MPWGRALCRAAARLSSLDEAGGDAERGPSPSTARAPRPPAQHTARLQRSSRPSGCQTASRGVTAFLFHHGKAFLQSSDSPLGNSQRAFAEQLFWELWTHIHRCVQVTGETSPADTGIAGRAQDVPTPTGGTEQHTPTPWPPNPTRGSPPPARPPSAAPALALGLCSPEPSPVPPPATT